MPLTLKGMEEAVKIFGPFPTNRINDGNMSPSSNVLWGLEPKDSIIQVELFQVNLSIYFNVLPAFILFGEYLH